MQWLRARPNDLLLYTVVSTKCVDLNFRRILFGRSRYLYIFMSWPSLCLWHFFVFHFDFYHLLRTFVWCVPVNHFFFLHFPVSQSICQSLSWPLLLHVCPTSPSFPTISIFYKMEDEIGHMHKSKIWATLQTHGTQNKWCSNKIDYFSFYEYYYRYVALFNKRVM